MNYFATTAAWRQLPLKVSAWQQYRYQYDTANTSFRVQVYMYWNYTPKIRFQVVLSTGICSATWPQFPYQLLKK